MRCAGRPVRGSSWWSGFFLPAARSMPDGLAGELGPLSRGTDHWGSKHSAPIRRTWWRTESANRMLAAGPAFAVSPRGHRAVVAPCRGSDVAAGGLLRTTQPWDRFRCCTLVRPVSQAIVKCKSGGLLSDVYDLLRNLFLGRSGFSSPAADEFRRPGRDDGVDLLGCRRFEAGVEPTARAECDL